MNVKTVDSRRVAFIVAIICSLLASAACRDAVYVETGAGGGKSAKPRRIISLSPSTTEVLWGVGAFQRVVAVSDYDDFPPEVKDLPKIGGWSNTNLEQVASLKPDLVVMTKAQEPFIKDKLDAMGIRYVSVADRTLADARSAITQIGAAAGEEEAAQKLLTETRAKLDDVRSQTQGLARPRVLCVVDRVPGTLRGLYAATTGSFFAELIEIAGGVSIAPASALGFGQISKEAVATLDPEIIIDMVQSSNTGKLAEDQKQVWGELSQVNAVRSGRVFAVRDTSVLHPSQRVGDTARKFAEMIHPEAFKK
ncbi:MAG: helical backbone metal receptor [Acidobacteria bacterium]|nr:helical backbone metal receptor [Acidobacteriota bacterium]